MPSSGSETPNAMLDQGTEPQVESTLVDAEIPNEQTGHHPPCPPGTPRCPCYPNNTCGRVNGVALSCEGGVCLAPEGAVAGGLGEPCGQDDDCAPYRGEVALSCEAGRCALAGCPTGASGCPCGPEGSCEEGATCGEGGFCGAAGCALGQPLCACAAGGACEAGARCEAGVCRPGALWALSVTDARARGCQARVALPEGVALQVRFDSGLRGQHVRRGQALGVSFVSRGDASAQGARALLALSGPEPALLEALLEDVRCVDRLGRPLRDPALSLGLVRSAPALAP